MVGLLLLGVVIVAAWLYVRTVARSRSRMEHLHRPPDDTRRADDNQRAPFDGSGGWV